MTPRASIRDCHCASCRRLSEGSTQNQFAGTPEQLADHVIAWQDAGAVDGFTIMG